MHFHYTHLYYERKTRMNARKPTVLMEHPTVRTQRVATPDVQVTRISEPVHHLNHNGVDVNFTVIATDQRTDRVEQHTEVHSMRYLFVPEIEFIAAQTGFEVFEAGEWLTGIQLHEHSWSGYVVVRATAPRP